MTLDTSRKSATFRERLLSRVVPQPDGCWLWQGKPNSSGYGRITVGPWGAGELMAHRAMWEEVRGPIPEGMVIDHLCLVKLCVNPDHLEVVTPGENTRRNLNCPSTKNRLATHCPKGHQFVQRKGQRRCRECTNERARNRFKPRVSCIACRMEMRRDSLTRHWRTAHALA